MTEHRKASGDMEAGKGMDGMNGLNTNQNAVGSQTTTPTPATGGHPRAGSGAAGRKGGGGWWRRPSVVVSAVAGCLLLAVVGGAWMWGPSGSDAGIADADGDGNGTDGGGNARASVKEDTLGRKAGTWAPGDGERGGPDRPGKNGGKGEGRSGGGGQWGGNRIRAMAQSSAVSYSFVPGEGSEEGQEERGAAQGERRGGKGAALELGSNESGQEQPPKGGENATRSDGGMPRGRQLERINDKELADALEWGKTNLQTTAEMYEKSVGRPKAFLRGVLLTYYRRMEDMRDLDDQKPLFLTECRGIDDLVGLSRDYVRADEAGREAIRPKMQDLMRTVVVSRLQERRNRLNKLRERLQRQEEALRIDEEKVEAVTSDQLEDVLSRITRGNESRRDNDGRRDDEGRRGNGGGSTTKALKGDPGSKAVGASGVEKPDGH